MSRPGILFSSVVGQLLQFTNYYVNTWSLDRFQKY